MNEIIGRKKEISELKRLSILYSLPLMD